MPSLIRVELPSVSGVPEDVVVNDWVVRNLDAADSSAIAQDVLAHFADFFNVASPEGLRLASFIGGSRSRAAFACTVRAYDITGHLSGTPFGSPFANHAFTLEGGDASVNLPEEVAGVITLRAAGWDTALVEAPDGGDAGTAKDRPRQRHTNRVFLGPLKASTLITDPVTGVTRFNSVGGGTFLQQVLGAVDRLNTGIVGELSEGLGIWSRTDAVVRQAVRAEMDNAFDTQRRRGPRATARSSVSLMD
jgi:hypothetical protein